jgi:predicted transcriptional regulator
MMSKNLVFCEEDADIEEAAQIMADKQLRRLLIKNNQDKITGH